MTRHGVSFRDPAALSRVLGHARHLRPERPKQLQIPGTHRTHLRCPACGKARARGAGGLPCDGCGSFDCNTCGGFTTGNGGVAGACLECLLVGRVGVLELAQSAE